MITKSSISNFFKEYSLFLTGVFLFSAGLYFMSIRPNWFALFDVVLGYVYIFVSSPFRKYVVVPGLESIARLFLRASQTLKPKNY